MFLTKSIFRLGGVIQAHFVKYTISATYSTVNRIQKMAPNANALPLNAAKRIVWIDMEMTGLDIERDRILEVACVVTDENLEVVAMGPDIVVHQPDDVLKSMGEWCTLHHGESGLTEASRQSDIDLAKAEETVLEFVTKHAPPNKCPLGGNSVYMDRLFLNKYMPKLNSYLHYRIIDVSSVKELAKRWYSKEYSLAPQKKFRHRAQDDILSSIEEMQYYKKSIFKSVI